MSNSAYTQAKLAFLKGQIAPLTDTLKVMLLDTGYTPNLDTDTFVSDIVAHELAATGNYARQTLGTKATTADATNHRAYFDAADLSIAAATFANVRYAAVFKDTGVAGTSPLLFLFDFGSAQQFNGDTFALQWPDPTVGAIGYIG